MCNLERETTEHFQCCMHYQVEIGETKNTMTKVLNKYQIDPYLRILLYGVLEGKQCTQQQLKIDYPNFPCHDYDTLLQSQNKIGWRNLTKGYVSVLWESHQIRYRKMMKLSTKEDEGVWIGKIMRCFLQYVCNIDGSIVMNVSMKVILPQQQITC